MGKDNPRPPEMGEKKWLNTQSNYNLTQLDNVYNSFR